MYDATEEEAHSESVGCAFFSLSCGAHLFSVFCRRIWQDPKHIQSVSGVLFFLYLAVLIYFLFFADEYGRTPSLEMRYNLVPLVEIRRFLVYRKILGFRAVFLNVYGNIIGFLPFGFFLPAMHRYFRRAYRTVSVSFLFSCGVELTQLVTRRGRGTFCLP